MNMQIVKYLYFISFNSLSRLSHKWCLDIKLILYYNFSLSWIIFGFIIQSFLFRLSFVQLFHFLLMVSLLDLIMMVKSIINMELDLFKKIKLIFTKLL